MASSSQLPNSNPRTTPADAAAALAGAEASRARLAQHIDTPSGFSVSIGVAIAIQIATTAYGLVEERPWVLVAGVVLLLAVAAVQLMRFRQRNGVWLGGFASRVVFGTGAAASASYAAAMGVAVWAAFAEYWGLVGLVSLAGGATYALSGRHWLRAYHEQPAVHAPGESRLWLAALTLAALVLLVVLAFVG